MPYPSPWTPTLHVPANAVLKAKAGGLPPTPKAAALQRDRKGVKKEELIDGGDSVGNDGGASLKLNEPSEGVEPMSGPGKVETLKLNDPGEVEGLEPMSDPGEVDTLNDPGEDVRGDEIHPGEDDRGVEPPGEGDCDGADFERPGRGRHRLRARPPSVRKAMEAMDLAARLADKDEGDTGDGDAIECGKMLNDPGEDDDDDWGASWPSVPPPHFWHLLAKPNPSPTTTPTARPRPPTSVPPPHLLARYHPSPSTAPRRRLRTPPRTTRPSASPPAEPKKPRRDVVVDLVLMRGDGGVSVGR